MTQPNQKPQLRVALATSMSKERQVPHPRAAVSGRMSVDQYRAMLGRKRAPSRQSPARKRARIDRMPSGVATSANTEFSPLPLSFSLPFLPPSVNGLYTTVVDRDTGMTKRVLSHKARNARKAIAHFVVGRLSPREIYELHIRVELPVLTKHGHLRKLDLTNRVKFLEDCVAARLGIDDCQFFRVLLTKFHAEHERTLVSVHPYGAINEAA